MKKSAIIHEAIGWYGMSAIVLAYALLSFGIINSDHLGYLLLNLTGSFGIMYISFKKKTYQPGVLNIIWAFLTIGALIKIFIL
jgi:hypothetical protein